MAWHGNTTDSVGSNYIMSSRLIQSENIATAEARKELTDAIVASFGGYFHIVAGKGVQERDPDGKETSVTPAWRKAVTHYVTIQDIEGQDKE